MSTSSSTLASGVLSVSSCVPTVSMARETSSAQRNGCGFSRCRTSAWTLVKSSKQLRRSTPKQRHPHMIFASRSASTPSVGRDSNPDSPCYVRESGPSVAGRQVLDEVQCSAPSAFSAVRYHWSFGFCLSKTSHGSILPSPPHARAKVSSGARISPASKRPGRVPGQEYS